MATKPVNAGKTIYLGEQTVEVDFGSVVLTGDVTGGGVETFPTTLVTNQPGLHTWALAQTFTVAPVFTDQAGTRTALGLGTLAIQSGTFSGTSSGTNTGNQTITLTGDVTGSGTGTFAATLATAQPNAHAWAAVQTFTLAPIFTDAAGTRTALGLGTLATQSGTFSGTSSGTNTGDKTITLTGAVTGSGTDTFATTLAAHASSHNSGGSDAMAIDAAAGTGSLRTLGTASTSAAAGNDSRLGTGADMWTRIFRSPLAPPASTIIPTSGTAYFVFLGRMSQATVIKFVEGFVTVAGVGNQVAEVGLFSSTQAPDKTNKTLTKLAADATVDAMTGGSFPRVVRNTTAFNSGAGVSVPAGTFLWAGIRTAMATTQPTFRSLGHDHVQGWMQTTAASGVLTGAGPFSGVVPAAAVSSALAPDLVATMD